MNRKYLLCWLTIITLMVSLIGCGDNDSGIVGTTVSGTAAAGAPLVGYISLIDSEGTTLGPNQIADDGAFSFDVANLVPPFYLHAVGTAGFTEFDLHSVAIGTGVTNINPIADAIAAAATGDTMDEVFADPTQYDAAQLQADLDEAVASIETYLQPLLDAFDATIDDYLNNIFNADGTGADQVFDLVDIVVTPSQNGGLFEVYDKSNPIDPLGAVELNNLNEETPPIADLSSVVEVKNDIEQIVIFAADFLDALRQASLDYAQNEDLAAFRASIDPYIAADFGFDDGRDRQAYIDDFAEDWEDLPLVEGIQSLAVVEEIAPSHYLLSGNWLWNGIVDPWRAPWGFVNVGGQWYITGNGHIVETTSFYGTTLRRVVPDGFGGVTVEEASGMEFWTSDATADVDSLLITGPGLPVDGIMWYRDSQNMHFYLDQADTYTWPSGATYSHVYVLENPESFADIRPFAAYEFEAFDQNGVSLATMISRMDGAPIDLSQLSNQERDALFPALDILPENQNLTWAEANLLNQDHTFNVTPSSSVDFVDYWVGAWGTDNQWNWFDYEFDVNSNQVTTNFVANGLDDLTIEIGGWSPAVGDVETEYRFTSVQLR